MFPKKEFTLENMKSSAYQLQSSSRQIGAESGLNFSSTTKEQIGDFDPKTSTMDPLADKDERESEINPYKIENENLIKKNFILTEEYTRLKCSFEAEKFSMSIIFGAKIESLEKELQQVLYLLYLNYLQI